MNNIKRKLNSNNGVSILFALVLFLVATIVSLVIIVTATSSLKRESSFKESVQRNIELDSASLLLKEIYANSSCSYTYDKIGKNYTLKSCSLGGLDDKNNPYIDVLEEISTNVIENNTNSFSERDAFSISDEIESYTNIVDCKYSIYASNDDSVYVVSFKLDNGSIMYCKFNLKIEDDNSLIWSYYQSSLKGGQWWKNY